MNDIISHIKNSFKNNVDIREKRPGIYQLLLPIFHEDGDMIELYIEQIDQDNYRLCDYGMTLMRLSYSYDIDTPTKEAILQRMISENRLEEDQGNIFLFTKANNLYADIMHICQAYMKIGSMRYFKREVIENLFYENLEEFIMSDLIDYNPRKNTYPIAERSDLQTDYELRPNGTPIFLFGVKDNSKARLAALTCLEYQKAHLRFKSLIVHNNFDSLSKNDRIRITNVCDKQFTSLDQFKNSAISFFEREK